ncbi:membrane-bound PQQ-dependent dehydrogenase, glucose/quinate/shikimate family [Rubellimicrobium mesophilum]|nr:membrane-bound PQQ-dependent dehydrogenase, glucose/quinate/shikimate family [Rubellimicrobium mesophilum]
MTEVRYRSVTEVRYGDRDATRPVPAPRSRHPWGRWLVQALGVILALIGLVLAVGGAWLVALGGSWYYLLAGLGLILSGALLLMLRMTGVWAYLLVYVATWAWAIWEVGGWDGWPLVPRVVAPTVLLILVLLAIPVLSRSPRPFARYGSYGAAALAALALGLAADGLLRPQPVLAQQGAATPEPGPAVEPAPEATAPAPTTPPAPDDATATPPAAGTATGAQATEAPPPPAIPVEASEDWPTYGGGADATRYSPLDRITPDNVAQLQQVWQFRAGDMPDQTSGADTEAAPGYAAETTPIKVGDHLYLCSAKNILLSLDAGTGREEWRHDPTISNDAIPYSATCRGVAYYANPQAAPGEPCAARIIEGTIDARLLAVDAATGQPCPDFGQGGQVSLLDGIGATVPGWYAVTSPPAIVRGVIVTGAQVSDNQAEDAPSGVIRGYDAVTGELRWAWDMERPDLHGAPPEGEAYSRGTPNSWTTATGDEELGYVYLPLGNSSVDYWGGNRTEAEDEYSSSVVAIDVATGRDVWHFQTVHYDVWDYDLGSQPSLVDFPTAEGTVPALILSSKQGEIYVLDRRTGEPIFAPEERPAPQGGVEPERLSPTQPFSTYHTLAFPPLTERQMWGMSPIDQLWCRIQFRRASYEGEYTPPTSDRHYIEYPSYNGGSDWGSLAVDAADGILVANYNNMANFNRLIPREEVPPGVVPVNVASADSQDAPSDLSPMWGSPYAIDVNAGWRVRWTGMLCTEPPYGGIRAIDLGTGETLWDRPLGEARRNGPWGIPSMLPVTIGTPNNGGPLVTAGGLIFIAATTDDMFRAIDLRTGEVLWETPLPAGGQATPMTYESDGRQYVVLMAGGHHFMKTPIGDHVLAWALPQQPEGQPAP